MFVSDNTLKSVKAYFSDRLTPIFSNREIRNMFHLCAASRLDISLSDVLLSDSLRMSESDLLYFRSVVKRLLNKEPFQYILGEVEFYGLTLKIDQRALIPRPETEELVDWIVQSHDKNSAIIADICSGSGCIALALKSKFPNTRIVGFDLSIDAINLSQENEVKTQLGVEFLPLDILKDELPFEDSSVDILVSNPPYVLMNEKAEMQEHVLLHEPHLALFVADDNAFIFYDSILQKAVKKLKKGGFLYFEINEKYGNEVVQLFEQYGFNAIEIKEDLQGKSRMVRGKI